MSYENPRRGIGPAQKAILVRLRAGPLTHAELEVQGSSLNGLLKRKLVKRVPSIQPYSPYEYSLTDAGRHEAKKVNPG